MSKRNDGTSLPTCRFKVPGTTVALLTFTAKMPGASWSLPAGKSCPFAYFGKGAICGSVKHGHDGCYASKGMYMWPAVRRAQEARYAWVRECLKTDPGVETFVSTMVTAITYYTSTDMPYFRVHDSGDLFSPKYTRAWLEIARRLPDVKFWFPTRSYRGPWLDVIRDLATLPNATVRPSALLFDTPAPAVDGLHAGTTATVHGFTCPASTTNNACGDCRACWNDKDLVVSYHKH